MTGNALHEDILRFPQSMLAACFDEWCPPCPWCQQPLPEHDWACLDGDTCVVECCNRRPSSTDPPSPVDGGP